MRTNKYFSKKTYFFFASKQPSFDSIIKTLNNYTVVEKDERLSLTNRCDLQNFNDQRKKIRDEDFWDEVHIRKIYKKANVKPT